MWSQFTLLLVGVAFVAAGPRNKRADRGPLFDYVYRPDPHYNWVEFDVIPKEGFTTYYLNLTSQMWYDDTLSSRPLWWHNLVVHVPDVILYPDAGFLYISTGSNPDGAPDEGNGHQRRTGEYAVATGMVTATLRYIPNQPIIFEDDRIPRWEDTIIAWTWKRFYNETKANIYNPEILLRMPMCKASVRAMDAMTEFMAQKAGNDITRFMVAGESKRGWTTWLVGAIDDRVVAMAPVVLSCVNMVDVFHHYYRSLGGWSFAMLDYWLQGLTGLIDEPEMKNLTDIVDPYSYLEWMTMPKLMVSGASDEYFMLDDYDYFFNDLLGPKYMWLLENSGHSIGGSPLNADYWTMLQTFFLGVLDNFRIPHFSWTKQLTETGGRITVFSEVTPVAISAWSTPSHRPDRRDFRKEQLSLDGNGTVSTDIVWTEKAVENLGGGSYRVEYTNPSEGYFAFFIKITLRGPGGRVYHFTTEGMIIPEGFPFEDCVGSECQGRLV